MVRDLLHRAAFENKGETQVRVMAQRQDAIGREAVAWLEEQKALREAEAAKLRDAREEETLQLARQANDIAARSAESAEKSMKAARISIVIAVISVLIAGASLILT